MWDTYTNLNSEHTFEKCALVLCDNELLFHVIATNLTKIHVKAKPWLNGHAEISEDVGTFDLIVIAFSAPTGEPLVSLFKAALTEAIGKIPLLIISDRRFDSTPAGQIFHLEFPFNAMELRRTVQRLLV